MKSIARVISIFYLSFACIAQAQTPEEYINSPYHRQPMGDLGTGYRGNSVYGSESGGTTSGAYPNAKRSLPPVTHLNQETGTNANLSYAGTLNTLVGSFGSATGMAASVASNLAGSGFVGADSAIRMSQVATGNGIAANSNLMLQFGQNPGGQAIYYPAFAHSLNRASTGDLSNPVSNPPMDAVIAAQQVGGTNLLPGQAAALANVPAGYDAALQAYKLAENPSHLARARAALARELADNGNGFFGLDDPGSSNFDNALNAWFKERLTDFIFNEHHDNSLPNGINAQNITTLLDGTSVEVWSYKQGWWSLFGDVVYGLGDDLELNAGGVAAASNRASQIASQQDVPPNPGASAVMDGVVLDAVKAIGIVLRTKCNNLNDENEDILDPAKYGSLSALATSGNIENDPAAKAALDFLKTDQYSFKASDADIVWQSLAATAGSGLSACVKLNDVINTPAAVVTRARGESGMSIQPWQANLYFFAENIAAMKFNMSVQHARDMINRRMTSKTLTPGYAEEALRLIDNAYNTYHSNKARFREALEGIYARFEKQTSGGSHLGASFQTQEEGTGQLGGN